MAKIINFVTGSLLFAVKLAMTNSGANAMNSKAKMPNAIARASNYIAKATN